VKYLKDNVWKNKYHNDGTLRQEDINDMIERSIFEANKERDLLIHKSEEREKVKEKFRL